jgi:hypothetical protein
MIEVTDRARQHLSNELPSGEEEACFRVVPTGTGAYGLALAAPNENDVTVEHEGNIVLSLERELAARLDGYVLDVGTSPDGGQRLTLRSSSSAP